MDPLDDHLSALASSLEGYRSVAVRLADWGSELARLLKGGGRLLVAGNGGSAAEAQHLAAELAGKLRHDRMPLSAIALTADSSAVTAISNDYGYDEVFARQVRAHGRPGDVLMLLSTSGSSPNLLAAARAAREIGVRTWAMTGAGDNPLADACDEVLRCPSPEGQVVQELHLVSVHVLCEHIDRFLGSPVMEKPDLVIVGDTLLDRDVEGAVRRIAPDAPAPVLDEASASERPGGAGLAAMLAAADGRKVALVTAIAADAAGERLTELLTAAGVQVYALPLPGSTPEKVRLRSGGQVLLRLDRGGEPQAPGDAPAAALDVIRTAPALLVSDYGRGVARHPAIRAALGETKAPLVWDPHPNGPAPVPDARLVTPNLAEVCKLAGDAGGGSALVVAQRAGHVLRQRWRAGAVVVTCGADGAVLCHSGPTPLAVATPGAVQGDTCGAGDRFASAAALALADGALVSEAVQTAVSEATAYVAAGGVTAALSPPEPDAEPGRFGADEAGRIAAEVKARGGTVVATGGCFDLLHIGHLATLRAARALGDCLIVCLNSDASVRDLKGPDRPLNAEADRGRLLAALDCVDAVVVFDETTPSAVLTWLRPDIWVKGGDYADGGPDLPEAELVKTWGGQTVIVPYVDGRSTTRTIAAARSGGK
jgi:D-beta-D-heptose 7-phosphate kinase / D-beta-D-heptose 1-phosphate adenosyltransferase